MINRKLNLSKLLGKRHSSFLFGPRGVGKTVLSSNFIKKQQGSLTINLLSHELYARYLQEPGLFRNEIENKIRRTKHLCIFIDEIQKMPSLLDEVHYLIETYKNKIQFLMTGSSVRKLKREGTNLLAGRAWNLKLHPLSTIEMKLDINKTLQIGSLPAIYLTNEDNKVKFRILKAYVENYIKEEILQEAIVRRADRFIRFLDVAGQMNSETINFTQVGKDAGVSTKTAQEYYSILEDTLLVHRLDGWSYSVRKQIRQGPKYYFFDCGIINTIRGELESKIKPGTFRYGRLFESFIIQECFRYNDYEEKDYKFSYWRTNTGLEVDLIIKKSVSKKPIAIEIKSKPNPTMKDLRALTSFASENDVAKLLCLCTTPRSYKVENIEILPWLEGIQSIFS